MYLNESVFYSEGLNHEPSITSPVKYRVLYILFWPVDIIQVCVSVEYATEEVLKYESFLFIYDDTLRRGAAADSPHPFLCMKVCNISNAQRLKQFVESIQMLMQGQEQRRSDLYPNLQRAVWVPLY